MPHQCMNCGKEYSDDSDEIMKGCSCGSTLFLFTKAKEEKKEKSELTLTKNKIMGELDSFLQTLTGSFNKKSSIEFDLESVKVHREGVYEINLKRLMDEIPLIVEIKDGTYHIHLASAFRKGRIDRFDIKELELGEPSKRKVKKTKKRK